MTLVMLAEGPVPEGGRCSRRSAAVLLIDISGFTALADSAAARFGDRGAERLQELLNRCFVPIVEAVELAGGEVLAFPGDAALCLWPVSPDDAAALASVIRQANECARRLRDHLDQMSGFGTLPLRFRAVVAAGPVRTLLAGGVDGRWNLVVDGPAIEQLTIIDGAAPGDVVMSDAARRACDPRRPGDSGRVGERPVPDRTSGDQRRGRVPLSTLPSATISRLLPISVRACAEAGHPGWMSEFRIVTVVFILVAARQLEDGAAHQIVRVIQTVNQRFDGDLNQVVVDEKGLNAVVVFGLLHQTHEDRGVRAVATAHELVAALRCAGINPRIGVASGRAFTGIRGSEARREFAVIGSPVVTAARLAGVADDILCDAHTQRQAKAAFLFEAAPPVPLKGKGIVADLWRPREPVFRVNDSIEAPAGNDIGRQVERQRIQRRLDALAMGDAGGLMVVTGDPGIGKSALVATARRAAMTGLVQCIIGNGDSIQRTRTLHPWQAVFTSLLAVGRDGDTAAVVARLTNLLGPDEADWFPLLNPVLPIQLPENEQTSRMTPESRARITRELLLSLLRRRSERPLFIILEDAHWLDSSSWELVEAIAGRIPGLLLLLTSRPTEDVEARLATIRAAHPVGEIALTAMGDREIREIVVRRIGAGRVSDEVAGWIETRCEGNPLFAQELTLMLLERAAATIDNGACIVVGERALAELTQLPDTVHGVLASRIDRLSADDQLMLKVASILGRDFRLESLAAINPLEEPAGAVIARIDQIVKTGLLVTVDGNDRLSFSHALVQEVAYSLLPFAQRHQLHQRAAEHFEGSGREAEALNWPLLAYHWEQAEVAPKAMTYLERAGEDALLKASANPEAERFFTRLIRLAELASPAPGADGRDGTIALPLRARWERMLSQAIARQGRHDAALSHLERGLKWLGQSIPVDNWKCRTEAVIGVIGRVTARPRDQPRTGRSAPGSAACLEAVGLYESMIQLLYLGQSISSGRTANTAVLSTVALLRSAGLAERAGPSGELSRSYSMVANLVAMLGRHALAMHYAERARQLAVESGDQQALFRALTIGQLPAFIAGRWHDVEQRLQEGIVLGASLRNLHESLISEYTLAYVTFHRGRLDEAWMRFASIESRGRDAGFIVPQLWAHAGMAEVRLRQERLPEAIVSADACLRLASEQHASDQNSRFQAHGVLASVRARRGEHEQALAEAAAATRAADAGAHLSFAAQAGFIGVTDALSSACAAGAIDRRDGEVRLRRWLWRLRVAALCRPIFEPWSLQFRAARNHRNGRVGRARRQLTKSIRVAERLDMPYEAASGRRALTELAPP